MLFPSIFFIIIFFSLFVSALNFLWRVHDHEPFKNSHWKISRINIFLNSSEHVFGDRPNEPNLIYVVVLLASLNPLIFQSNEDSC